MSDSTAATTDLSTPATTAPSPAAPSLNSQPSTLNPAASTPEARLRALLVQLKDVQPSWFWSKRWSVSNHIVTGRRVLIATLWAAPWMYLQQHNAWFAVHAGWAIVLLLPLPWVIFRWLDHPIQGPLTLKTGVGLGVGTTVPFMLASPLSALGDWLIHGLPRTVAAVFSLYAASPQTKPATELETRNAKIENATTAPVEQRETRNSEREIAPSAAAPSSSPESSGVTTPAPVSKPPPSPPIAHPSAVVFTPPAPMTVTAPERKSDVSDAADESSSRGRTPSAPPQSAVRNPQLPESAVRTPQFPTAPGAYALTAAGWVPLPRNGSTTIALTPHAPYPEDKQPAGATELIVAELLFSGSDAVPVMPATGAMLIYVGPLSSRGTPLELGPLNVGTGIARLAPLTNSVGGPGLGPRRVAATLEQVSATVTVLHPTARLAPGRYALHGGDQFFEVGVEEKR